MCREASGLVPMLDTAVIPLLKALPIAEPSFVSSYSLFEVLSVNS